MALASPVDFPGTPPGEAKAVLQNSNGVVYTLGNEALKVEWRVEDGKLWFGGIANKLDSHAPMPAMKTALLRLSTTEGGFDIPAERFILEGKPSLARFGGDGKGREGGVCLSATLKSPTDGLTVRWKAELRDGSSYVKETFEIVADKDVDLRKIELVSFDGVPFRIEGKTAGSPLVSETGLYAGVELPVAIAQTEGDRASIGFDCKLPMKKGETQTFSTVKGVWVPGQLRRSFLYYLERERATPYHQFLHYNGWYDDGLNPTSDNLIATAKAYGQEFGKRQTKLDGFVLDDGWDDVNEALWQPSSKKFPGGFGKTVEAVKEIPAHFGIWISPLGGYFGTDQRVEQAQKIGALPQDASEFDLSIPSYRNWFRDRCASLMQDDGVAYFKWDKAGKGVSPHFMALLGVSHDLRQIDPKVFINVTVGTWPSPFWLNHIDCTWRDGTADVAWAGKGNSRERSITYRDGACYGYVVTQGPLYPLNSIMHHGLVLGREFQAQKVTFGETGDEKNFDLKKDARIFFGSGANLQELYLSPSLMNAAAWDDITQAARWARRHENVLVDAHWVGGNPNKLEPYGFAAWTRVGATLALRNPDDASRTIELDAREVFEPDATAPVAFHLKAAYPDQRVRELELEQGKKVSLTLEPFEVLVFDRQGKKDE